MKLVTTLQAKQHLYSTVIFLASLFTNAQGQSLNTDKTDFSSTRKKTLPNLVLIVADDLGYGDLGIQGSKQIPTPNIDQLAREGIIFTNGYVSSPVCAPSRAGLMTGKNQAGFGFNDNLAGNQPGFDANYLGLPLTEQTLANKLKSLGYTTGLVGKWHLGAAPHFNPVNRGFDEFWGFLDGGHDYFTAKPDGSGMESAIQCNYKKPDPLTYMSDDIGNESVDFIRRHKNHPFFLYAAFNAPHAPMQATDEDLKLFSHVKDKLRQTYCAMVYRLDQNIGKIVKTVQEQGLERNTVVVFISDNGGPANSISNGSINAPLRGQKTTLLEGGIRVPFFLKWPAMLDGGKKCTDPVSALDICPTFIDAAGGTVSEKDHYTGVSILPYLTGQTKQIPHQTMEWRYTAGSALREGDWKLIRLPDRLPMLYHLSVDIAEEHDVSASYPDKTRSMLKKLGTWELRLPHPVFHEPADWRIRHIGFYDATYQLVQPQQ
jgi:arylsulfatase A-like enzyme